MTAVFLRCGGPDDLHLAPAQGGLEDIGRVNGPFSRARADDGVQLVDKEDHVPGPLHVLQHRLDPLLEISPVLGPSQQRRNIQGDDPLFPQLLRRLAPGHPERQSLGHGGLAHAGLAHQDGIVLAAPGQDLHRPADLLAPAHHRVDVPGGGHGGQIPAVLVQGPGLGVALGQPQRSGLGAPSGGRVSENGGDLRIDPVRIRPQQPQKPAAAAVRLPQDPQEQMLGPDEGLPQLGCLPGRPIHREFGMLAQFRLTPSGGPDPVHARQAAPDRLFLQALAAQDPCPKTRRLLQDPQEQMLRAHKTMPQLFRRPPGPVDGQLCQLRKLLVAFHVSPPPDAGPAGPAASIIVQRPRRFRRNGAVRKSIASFSGL